MTQGMTIPFLDLRAQFAEIREEIFEAVHRVVESQEFILGEEVECFEKEFSSYIGITCAVGLASGTDALALTLRALELRPGDEVITTPYTFFSTISSIVLAGGRPVFVDIDPQTFNIDPERIEQAITERTRTILPVHLFGQCADMKPILELARSRGIFVLEDAAQAAGAACMGKKAGALGDAAAFSFYPSKNLGAFGDAGMMLTAREDIWKKVQELRVHGSRYSSDYSALGINSRLDALQAAVLRVKLKHLDHWVKARREKAENYHKMFLDSPVQTPAVSDRCEHAFYCYVIRVPNRDELASHLKEKGIGCAVYYPVPLHQMSCFSEFSPQKGSLKEAEKSSRESLAIPIYPELTLSQQEHVASAIIDFLEKK
jgi:dTDP-4-amino-4,6-dideoxygalactose transaminase